MIAVLFVCKILYEGFYTMLNIPMGSLLSAMANTDEERAQLSSARGICSTIFGILASMLFPIIIAVFGDNSKGYGIGITVLALVGMVLCFLHYFWTEERNLNVINARAVQTTSKSAIFWKCLSATALSWHCASIVCSFAPCRQLPAALAPICMRTFWVQWL